LRALSFDGATALSPSELSEAAGLRPDDRPDPAAIREAAERIREAYVRAGYLFATVTPCVRRAPALDLVMHLSEGPRVAVASWRFPGAVRITEDALRAQLDTHDGRYNTAGGIYRADLWEQRDVVIVRLMYFDNGFLAVKIGNPTLTFTADRSRVTVSVPIEEGRAFRIGKVAVTGDRLAGDQDLTLLRIRPGQIFSRWTTAEDAERIRLWHVASGQPNAEVTISPTLDEVHAMIDVELHIAVGPSRNR
jgi:outer membrane protein insertion porin family